MKYICTESFDLQKYDDDGFVIANDYMTIEIGEIWEEVPQKVNYVAGQDAIHLVHGKEWCEILRGTLDAYFRKLEE